MSIRPILDVVNAKRILFESNLFFTMEQLIANPHIIKCNGLTPKEADGIAIHRKAGRSSIEYRDAFALRPQSVDNGDTSEIV